jgi:hypothetical protein
VLSFLSFACPKERNKEKDSKERLHPFPCGVFQFGFCTTVVKGSGAAMAMTGLPGLFVDQFIRLYYCGEGQRGCD